MAVTLASQARTIIRAVNETRPWVNIALQTGDPEVRMRVYLRGDLRKVPPQKLRAIIEQGRKLADGGVWQRGPFQVRRVESYLEVFPKGVEMPPPFYWEKAHNLSDAVVLGHDREVLASALGKADPRYLVLLAGDLSVAEKEISSRIDGFARVLKIKADKATAVRERATLMDEWTRLNATPAGRRAARFTALGEALRTNFGDMPINPQTEVIYREKFYSAISWRFALPGVSSDLQFLREQPVDWLKGELEKALPLYGGFSQGVETAIEQRFLTSGGYVSFALFLGRLATAESYVEEDFAPSPVSLRPEQLGASYGAFREKIAHWSRRYLEIFPA